MDIEEEIARAMSVLYFTDDPVDPSVEDLARAIMPLVRRVQAEALREVFNGAVLSWHSLEGVTVWDSEDHYAEGTPRPLVVHEWLERRADRIEQEAGA